MHNTRQRQEVLLEILEDIDNVCRKNNIKYTLYAGTLLGAIRHKGFIPWDDDADVAFERREYEKFMAIYPQAKKKDYYLMTKHWLLKVVKGSPSDRSERTYFVDIFIFDCAHQNAIAHRLHVFVLKILQGMLKENINYGRYNLIGKTLVFLTHMMGKAFSREWKLSLYSRVSQWINNRNTDKLGVFNTMFAYIKCVFPKKIVQSYEHILFENKKFMALSASHEVLSILYGDYMTLPPEKDRVPSHEDCI